VRRGPPALLSVALALLAGAARAQTTTPWTLVAGDAGGKGADWVSAQFGWPSISLGYTHGVSDRADLGVRFDLIYGVESAADVTQLGVGLRFPLRVTVVRSGRVSLLVHVDPGIKAYTYSDAQLGLQFPAGLTWSLRAGSSVWIALSFDAPMTVLLTGVPKSTLIVGVQPGLSIEYALDRQLSLSLDTRFGPLYSTPQYFPESAQFGFRTQVGVALKL
jgi:hypothetical protein